MVHVTDWAVDLSEEDESLERLEQVEMVSESNVEGEREWAHEFREDVPQEWRKK